LVKNNGKNVRNSKAGKTASQAQTRCSQKEHE